MFKARKFLPARLFAGLIFACLLVVGGCSQNSGEPEIYQSLASGNVQLNANEARNIINQYRQSLGLASLTLDPVLMAEADQHARDMASQDEVGHNVSSRGGFAARIRNSGVQRAHTAENVGAGYHTIAQAFSGWRGSPNHDRNMRSSESRRMGIAAAYNAQSKYKVFWVLIVTSD
ncbi:MAG: CAP domain-containing protein [Rhizobiales bacterium]|nr:CAP domain-containing protein [Hyphomicrobiales bacterium]